MNGAFVYLADCSRRSFVTHVAVAIGKTLRAGVNSLMPREFVHIVTRISFLKNQKCCWNVIEPVPTSRQMDKANLRTHFN